MKKTLLLLILILSTPFTFSQTRTPSREAFILKGKLLYKPGATPHCGKAAWATVAEFQIIEFSDKSYTKEHIGVIFTCPESYGERFFEPGASYTLTVINEKPNPLTWSIPSLALLDKYKLAQKLWVLKAEKIK